MQAQPDQGECRVFLVFHIDEGRFDGAELAGLNVVIAAHTPGPMGEGNWTVAAYLDSKASPKQQEALGAIFTGAAGGPMSALAPLIARNLGAKVAPIAYHSEGKRRSAHIPGVLEATVHAVPGSVHPEEVVVKRNAHPLFPELVQAYGVKSTYTDHGFRWDNSGKCADYASFRWAGS